MDNALEASSEIKRRERKKNTARWKGITFSDCHCLMTMKQGEL